MKVAAIVPALNEEERIGSVLETLVPLEPLHEIIVVNDGSRDRTSEIARSFPQVTTIDFPENQGKGAAMRAGAQQADADLLLFLDADLLGLKEPHVRDLLNPVLRGEADMTVGVFRGGRLATDLSHFLVSYISGQRAIRRELFLSIPGVAQSRSGVETVITRYVKARGLRVRNIAMKGVTHPMKEEKIGLLPGSRARLRMYYEIVRSLLNGHDPGG
jgi:glycosyltransferase involved in cell wall biosynthesis